MTPERLKQSLSVLVIGKTEEIFEPPLDQRVAFHVEEQIPGVRARETLKPPTRIRPQELPVVLPVLALKTLERRLSTQSLQSGRLNAGNPRAGRQCGQLGHRGDALGSQFLNLTTCDARNEAQVIGRFPLTFTPLAPATQ